jgi:hypothetical protein
LSDDYDKSVIIMSSAGGNESLDFRFSRLGCMIRGESGDFSTS